MEGITWRPYQVDAKLAIKENFDKGITEQLAVLATGLGKRMMAIDLMNHFPRSLFIAHREELIIQAYEEIEKYFPMQCGIIKGPRFEIEKKIVVASVQTLVNRLGRIPDNTFNYVAIDEVHHFVSKSFLKTVRHFTPALQIGWTATPKRLDGISLSNIAQKIVFEYGIDKGVNDGFLAKLDAYSIGTQTDLSKVKKIAGDFNIKQLSESVDNEVRNLLIMAKYKEYCPKGEQAIGFAVDVRHAYRLKEAFLKYDIIAEAVVSDKSICPNRSDIIKNFKNGNIQVLFNVGILTEGFDYSDVGCVLMARPTQSETVYVQAIGRGTRVKSDAFQEKFGHNHCIILDFVDNTGKHSLINAYELEKSKPIEERVFLPQEHTVKLLEERKQREIQMREGKDKKMDLLQLPEIKVWNSERMREPATEKQLDWIKREGLFEEGVEYTKLQASEVISNIPIKPGWQIKFLRERNYDVSNGVTMGQFQKIYQAYKEQTKYQMK